jgi:hypothetical protein
MFQIRAFDDDSESGMQAVIRIPKLKTRNSPMVKPL